MALVKPKLRSQLGPDMLDMLLRIKMHDATVKTLDVNRIVFQYLLKHRSCDKDLGTRKDLRLVPDEGANDNDPFQMDVDEADLDSDTDSESGDESCDDDVAFDHGYANTVDEYDPEHGYAFNAEVDRRLVMPDGENPFRLFNIYKGQALTVVRSVVYTKAIDETDDLQLFFKYESAIVSSNGKCLQANGIGKPVTLETYNANDEGQKWSFKTTKNGIELVSELLNSRLDLIGELVIGAPSVQVGVKRKANQFNAIIQKWRIREYPDETEE